MPPPTQLAIATGSVRRLLKEQASYHKELLDQEAQIKSLDEKIKSGQTGGDGNEEFMLKQQQLAVEQTKAVFEPIKQRLAEATIKLEEQTAEGGQGDAAEAEMEQAREVLAQVKADKNGTT